MFDIVWITVWRNFIFKNNMLIIIIDFVIVINVIKISFRSISVRFVGWWIWFFYAMLVFNFLVTTNMLASFKILKSSMSSVLMVWTVTKWSRRASLVSKRTSLQNLHFQPKINYFQKKRREIFIWWKLNILKKTREITFSIMSANLMDPPRFHLDEFLNDSIPSYTCVWTFGQYIPRRSSQTFLLAKLTFAWKLIEYMI